MDSFVCLFQPETLAYLCGLCLSVRGCGVNLYAALTSFFDSSANFLYDNNGCAWRQVANGFVFQ